MKIQFPSRASYQLPTRRDVSEKFKQVTDTAKEKFQPLLSMDRESLLQAAKENKKLIGGMAGTIATATLIYPLLPKATENIVDTLQNTTNISETVNKTNPNANETVAGLVDNVSTLTTIGTVGMIALLVVGLAACLCCTRKCKPGQQQKKETKPADEKAKSKATESKEENKVPVEPLDKSLEKPTDSSANSAGANLTGKRKRSLSPLPENSEDSSSDLNPRSPSGSRSISREPSPINQSGENNEDTANLTTFLNEFPQNAGLGLTTKDDVSIRYRKNALSANSAAISRSKSLSPSKLESFRNSGENPPLPKLFTMEELHTVDTIQNNPWSDPQNEDDLEAHFENNSPSSSPTLSLSITDSSSTPPTAAVEPSLVTDNGNPATEELDAESPVLPELNPSENRTRSQGDDIEE